MFEIALINKTFVYRKSLKDLFRKNWVLAIFKLPPKPSFELF
jgi:hypothetical protein